MLWSPPRELREWYMANATLGDSERYRIATRAELYYLGQQYAGMSEWDDRSIPLRKRAPRIIVPIFREAVDELSRFVWGGHRFPSISVGATRLSEDEAPDDVGPLVDKQQAAALSRFAAAVVKQGQFARAAREYTTKALINTSAACVVSVRGGYLTYYVEPGRHCTPQFDDARPDALESLEILYKFPRDEATGFGYSRTVEHWYRRVIDAERDVTFVEVPVVPGRPPEWREDPARTVEHRLGFCPVRWMRTLPESADRVDGRPVIDPQLYPLIDDLCRMWSQKGRAVNTVADVQLLRTGVPLEERTALQKSALKVWDVGEKADAKFLEPSGIGAQRAGEHIREMTQAFRDAVGIVKASPEVIKGDVSGVVLELLHRPMLALAADLRADMGEDAFAGLVNLALRMVCVLNERGEDVWIPGIRRACDVMRTAQLRGVWLDFPIAIHWPPFFAESPTERKLVVDTANAAVQGGLITAQTGTRAVADVFHIDDPEAEHEAVEEEQLEVDSNPMLRRPVRDVDDAPEEAPVDAEIEAKPAEPGEQ